MSASTSNDAKVFVGGLLPHTNDQSLVAYFSQFGEVVEARVVMDRQTGRSKNYGFVRLSIFLVFPHQSTILPFIEAA